MPAVLAKSGLGEMGELPQAEVKQKMEIGMEVEAEGEMEEGSGEVEGNGQVEVSEQAESSVSSGSSLPGGLGRAEERIEELQEKLGKKIEKADEKQEKLAEKLAKEQEKAAEKLAKLQEKLQENKERFLQEKLKYEEKRKEFLEGKEDLFRLREEAKCREKSEECQQKKLELKQGMKQHLVNTIVLIGQSIFKLQAKVEASNVLSTEEKQSALARLEALEQSLVDKKAEIVALGDDVSGAELKRQIKDLKKLWQEVRKEQRRILSNLISQRQEKVVDVYGRFVEKMEERIADLAEKGAEEGIAIEQLNELRALLEAYKSKVEVVNAAQEEAREAWSRAREEGTPEAMKAAREKQEQFKAATKEAKAALRALLVKYREVRAPVDVAEQERQPGQVVGVPAAIPTIQPLEPVEAGPAGVPTAMETGAAAEAAVSAEASTSAGAGTAAGE
jgi:chromosome segregation ATPase